MRATKATVSLGAIGHNLKSVMQLARSSKVLPVIKANAYGHGAIEIARKLESFRSSEVPAFAVAFMQEAVGLRQAGITRPLMVLQGSNQASDVAEAAASDFWLMVHNQNQVEHLLTANLSQAVRVWVKVDTGMHRLGFDDSQLGAAFSALVNSGNVQKDIVLCSHLACADELNNPTTQVQVEKLQRLAKQYKVRWSIANSAGIIGWPQSHADWVRPGYMLYGNSPLVVSTSYKAKLSEAKLRETRLRETKLPKGTSGDGSSAQSRHAALQLKPAMTMTSEIIAIRQIAAGDAVGYGLEWVAPAAATIGIVSIGYADGYPRHAASGTPVWLRGQRLPLLGRVSMDMIAVDLSQQNNAAIGDRVELWGQHLNINEVAAHAGTIGYEILAGLTGRVPISYLP